MAAPRVKNNFYPTYNDISVIIILRGWSASVSKIGCPSSQVIINLFVLILSASMKALIRSLLYYDKSQYFLIRNI